MYLTAQDYLDRFGNIETVRLTDEDKAGTYDSEKLETAISDATEEANAYLGKRYSTPLETPPELVKGIVAVLARETLFRRAGVVLPPALKDDADLKRSQLRDLARGTMILPTEEGALEEDARAPADSATSGDYLGPTFSEESLAGFDVPGGFGVARWRL